MEIVRAQNTRAIAEFYPHEIFHEVAIFEIFFEKIEKSAKQCKDNAPALQVFVQEPG